MHTLYAVQKGGLKHEVPEGLDFLPGSHRAAE